MLRLSSDSDMPRPTVLLYIPFRNSVHTRTSLDLLLCLCAHVQEFRAFSHGGKPKVLVMSYPCFRMHKAEVYKMGMDVVMCDEAHILKNGEAQITQAVAGLTTATRRLLMSGMVLCCLLQIGHVLL